LFSADLVRYLTIINITGSSMEKLPSLPKPKYLRRKQARNGGYAMVPAYTEEEMKSYALSAVLIVCR
jgi:hypothetical protein